MLLGVARMGHGLYAIVSPDPFTVEPVNAPERAERGDGQPRPPRNFVSMTVGVLIADLTPAATPTEDPNE